MRAERIRRRQAILEEDEDDEEEDADEERIRKTRSPVSPETSVMTPMRALRRLDADNTFAKYGHLRRRRRWEDEAWASKSEQASSVTPKRGEITKEEAPAAPPPRGGGVVQIGLVGRDAKDGEKERDETGDDGIGRSSKVTFFNEM